MTMFEITEEQAKGIKYMIDLANNNAADKITMANEALNKDFEYAYSVGAADEMCKQHIIQKRCSKFLSNSQKAESLRDLVVDFLNALIKDYFAWQPSSSTSIPNNRHKDIQRQALADIIEKIGNICPLIDRFFKIVPLFK